MYFYMYEVLLPYHVGPDLELKADPQIKDILNVR